MKIDLSSNPRIKALAHIFAEEGLEFRVVGGAVRDLVLGETPADFDFCTPTLPIVMLSMAARRGLKTIPTLAEYEANPEKYESQGGLKHGTVPFVFQGEVFEVTTLRVDVETNGRHAEVEFTTDWRADAARRDFTFNAMSLDVETGEVYDYFDGIRDLKAGVVRFVGNPDERLAEDYLRLLRFFRFLGRYGKRDGRRIDADTARALTLAAPKLNRISGERIWKEMGKILLHRSAPDMLFAMSLLGVLDHTVCSAAPIDYDDLTSVFERTKNPVTRLSMLCRSPHHADELADRLKLSGEEASLLRFLARTKQVPLTLASAKQMAAMSRGPGKEKVLELTARMRDRATMNYIRDWAVPTFPLQGQDLLGLGFDPGPLVGQTLRDLEELWHESDYEETRESLLARARELKYPP